MLGRPLYGCDDSILAWLPELGTPLVLETKRIVTFFSTWLSFFLFFFVCAIGVLVEDPGLWSDVDLDWNPYSSTS